MTQNISGSNSMLHEHSFIQANSDEYSISPFVSPSKKIKVFISSKCGSKKYDDVRAKLKKAIESTKLADAYVFEGEGASSLSAGSHYTLALEDCDICIFLIDNKDGISDGVQKEIDTVKKHNIKALYYFCDEKMKKKTALELSLQGASFAKSTTVHKFEDLSKDGAQALINDIITVYHYYCKGKNMGDFNDSKYNDVQNLNAPGIENIPQQTVPKTVLSNVDICKRYILNFVTGISPREYPWDELKTGDIDEWGVQFLPVLLEAKSIKEFNTSIYLDILKEQQTDDYHNIVKIRWKAIECYFLGEVDRCVEFLKTALQTAKETNQPTWIIKDILIDLRNQEIVLGSINNCYSESEAQNELTNSSEELYYPLLDRVHNSLHEKYIEGMYKNKLKSPYTITLSSDLSQYGDLLASSYVISMYNASLTHILLLHEELQNLLFYLCTKYDGWTLRLNMLKMAIHIGKSKDIKAILDTYPEILNQMDAKDAAEIMAFCDNHPVQFEKTNSQLLALGSIGYYLDDELFEKYSKEIINEIETWLTIDNPIVAMGQNIFYCLSGVSVRLDQDKLAKICCMYIEKHYSRWYMEMFKFIHRHLRINKMSKSSAGELINSIISVLENDDEREMISYYPYFLDSLRKQNWALTADLDKTIATYMPSYYNGGYRLETATDDYSEFITEYTKRIHNSNITQGKNGAYFGHGTRDISTIRSILLLENDYKCDSKLMDDIISTVVETLIISNEGAEIKLDAISLLISIVIKYPNDFQRNSNVYQQLFDRQEEIQLSKNDIISSNINEVSLKISLQFLFTAMGYDTCSNILELMPYVQTDIATTIAVVRIISKYLELSDSIMLPVRLELVLLQNILQWVHSDNNDVRWYSTKILFSLLRNPENRVIINNQLINIVDSDNLYIKNLIMRNIFCNEGIFDSTRQYITSKLKTDSNYIVRMVCEEKIKEYEE